jgi:methionine-S-sulfoxide reductase
MTTEKAVLAGGCFWGMQDMFRRLRGVVSTRVGYTGGDLPNPSYGNHQGHAEAIEIIFDPAVVSYRAILERFFQVHDPTTYEQQGATSDQATVLPSSTRTNSRRRRRSRRLPKSKPLVCGPVPS